MTTALHDLLDTVPDRQRIHTGPLTHSGPRETGFLVGQSVPYSNEHVRGYWYSRGFA